MKRTEKQRKIEEVHESLQSHDWLVISGKQLNMFEPAVTNDRRLCLSCERIEWSFPNLDDDRWVLDASGLARGPIDLYIQAIYNRIEAIRTQDND